MSPQKLGTPVDIGAARGRAPNRIYRIGIELEGGWTKLPAGIRQLQHDGSVVIDQELGEPRLTLGELANGPMTMTEWQAWVKMAYPQRVNDTCGMHVHFTPSTALAYSRLMCPEYPGTVVASIRQYCEQQKFKKDHPIWPRLSGKSRFCQHLYMADDQVRNAQKDHDQHRQGHRYTVINYCHARTGTIECRLLPMMETADQAIRLIQEFLDITNAFLRATRKREQKYEAAAMVDGSATRSRRRLFV